MVYRLSGPAEGKMKILLVDDMRDFEVDYSPQNPITILNVTGRHYIVHDGISERPIFLIARNVADAKILLEVNRGIDTLYLDNDLGTDDEGYDLLNWLEDPKNSFLRPGKIIPVTSNPAAKKRMEAAIRAIYD